MENNNLMKAVSVLLDNNFYINIILPLLITKVNVEDSDDVNLIFEILALTCEKFTKKKDSYKINIE